MASWRTPGVRPIGRPRRLLAVLTAAAVVVTAAPAWATHDGSTPPTCSALPAGAETLPIGSNTETIELRHLRRENGQTCRVLAYWDAQLHGQVDDVRGRLVSIHGRQADPVTLTRGGTAAVPLHTTGSTSTSSGSGHGASDGDPTFVRLASTSAQLLDDQAHGLARVLQFSAGLLVGFFLMVTALRRVM